MTGMEHASGSPVDCRHLIIGAEFHEHIRAVKTG